MKRHDLTFAALLVPLDYLAVIAAAWVAYDIRFEGVTGLLPVVSPLSLHDFLRVILPIGFGWVLILALSGVFSVQVKSLSREFGRIFIGSSFAVLILIVAIFFRREFVTSRFIVLVGWGLSIVFLWVVHAIVRAIQRYARRSGLGVVRTALFGNDATTTTFIEVMHQQRSLGVSVVRVFPNITVETLNEFEKLIQDQAIDAVYVTDPNMPKNETIQVLERCNDTNISFAYAADLFETEIGRIHMRDLAGIPIIEIQRTTLDGWGRILKRAVDLVGSMVLIIILFIPGVFVAIAIKLDSAGPIFFRPDRVGQGQRRFKLWKFRSMIRDAHAMKPQLMAQNERHDGPLFKLQNDPRITRLGRFIRKTSLDELPQLLNVFEGTMSLVGPRPHEPEEVARYDRHHKKVLTIKPGMTGMAQVSGRSNLTFEEEVRLDTYYIENWSLGLDAQILMRTPLAVLNTSTAA